MRVERETIARTGMTLAGATVFAVCWELVGMSSMSEGLIPTFSQTVARLSELLVNGVIAEHVGKTLLRAYTGFAIGSVLGLVLGLVIGWYRYARYFFDFLIDFLRNVSAITLIPITVLAIGIGFGQKVFLVSFACFFPVALNTINGVAATGKNHIEAAYAMGATDLQVIRQVVIYAALPSIFTGLRLAMGIAFVVVIAAELVGAQTGLGFYLLEMSRTYKVTNMFAAALFVSILGYLSSKVVVYTGDYLMPWRSFEPGDMG